PRTETHVTSEFDETDAPVDETSTDEASADETPADDVVTDESGAADAAEQGDAEDADAEQADEPEEAADPLQEFRDRLWTQPGDWYVIHTYAGMEKRVQQNLENRKVALNAED